MFWSELLIILLIIFLFYYKRNWRPKKPSFFSKGELIKIGHRGAPSLAYENTLDSFIKAMDAGMDGIELDVQFSADKQLIVYHNWALKTLSGIEKRIEKTLTSKL